MRELDRHLHHRSAAASDLWPANDRQAPRIERRPTIGRAFLEMLAWISESNWRIGGMIASALFIGLIMDVILP